VISYVQNEELVVVTHRIVRIDPEQNRVHTKGETNDTEDPPVHFNNVIGVVKFHIPLLGYVSDWVQNPPGMYITVGVGAVLMILVFMPNPFDKKKKGAVAAAVTAPVEETPAEPLPTEEAK
jgi:signal peptidase